MPTNTETQTCGWLVQIASNNPEPDFPEDLYHIVPCGAPLIRDDEDGWECEDGHVHHTYGSAAWREQDYADWMEESGRCW